MKGAVEAAEIAIQTVDDIMTSASGQSLSTVNVTIATVN